LKNFAHWKGQTRYRTEGRKLTQPISHDEFREGMENGLFINPNQKAYVILLYYTAVRKTEARRSVKEQFQVTKDKLIFSVGKRLKHGIETPPLSIPLNAEYLDLVVNEVQKTKSGCRVFLFSDKTAYNIVHRVFHYPHFFRLSRITNFFLEGWTIAQVHSWTGLSLKALDFYLGLVDIEKMGESLAKVRT
jgi:integrase